MSYRARSVAERLSIDVDEVTAGDETSVTVDSEPGMTITVFNESEVRYREPLN